MIVDIEIEFFQFHRLIGVLLIEAILLTAARIITFSGTQPLTNASGFFFRRDGRLYLVTSRHVLRDEFTHHFPDRIEIEIHTDAENLAESTGFSMLIYQHNQAVWRQGSDSSGDIDVAVLEINQAALPGSAVYAAFTPEHFPSGDISVPLGTPILIMGFPLGFHDTLHHIPVGRHAIVASSYGFRFQGKGYFLTDGRMHRGSSGAPVVMHMRETQSTGSALPWYLLGIHSARIDLNSRDLEADESLGLNCAWYADILMTLTI